jgi:hypothetical protein
VDAGGGSDNQDGRGDRMPPDEEQMRLGRARLARGGDPLGDQTGLSDGLIGGSAPRERENVTGSSGVTAGPPMAGPMATPVVGAESIDLAPRFRPWSEPATATAGPLRCHFLRSVGPDGRLTEAQRAAVPTHRCAAFGDPLPLSLRQQELVCLQRVHVSCPRYVRGTLLANETPSSPANDKGRRRVPILSIVGVGLVVLALAVVAAAMLGLPPFGGGAIAPTAATVVVSPPPASPTSSAAAQPLTTATPAITASIAPSALPSALPSATVKPTPAPTPIASAWPPGATASRMNLVVRCAGQANCYVYIVRGSGPAPAGNGSGVPDSLTNIATFFGVSVSDINALNPWASAGIHAGDKLKIPPPTR